MAQVVNLFKSNNNKSSEYRDEEDKLFDPLKKFADNSDFIEWLEENNFPETGRMTDEEIDDMAEEIASDLGMRGEVEVINAAKHTIEEERK